MKIIAIDARLISDVIRAEKELEVAENQAAFGIMVQQLKQQQTEQTYIPFVPNYIYAEINVAASEGNYECCIDINKELEMNIDDVVALLEEDGYVVEIKAGGVYSQYLHIKWQPVQQEEQILPAEEPPVIIIRPPETPPEEPLVEENVIDDQTLSP